MDQLNFQISHFNKLYDCGDYSAAHKVLLSIKSQYELHPKFIKLVKSKTGYIPPDNFVRRVRLEIQNFRHNAVINACGSLLQKHPYSTWLLTTIGLAFTKIENFNEAKIAFSRILELNPNSEEGQRGMGNMFFEKKDTFQAITWFEKALKTHGRKFDILVNLAASLFASNLNHKSIIILDEALSKNPNDKNARLIKINALTNLGETDQAIKIIHELKKDFPDSSDLKNLYASIQRGIGNTKKAEQMYKEIIFSQKFDDIIPQCIYTLANITHIDLDDPLIQKIEKILEHKSLNTSQTYNLKYALYFIHHKNKNFDKAFGYLKEANTLKKTIYRYNIDGEKRTASEIKNFFLRNKKEIDKFLIEKTPKKPIPIFIVGMPRSGTSLLEAILDQQSEITSLGELPYLHNAVTDSMHHQNIPDFFNSVTKNYYDNIDMHNIETPFFVDKLPMNFQLIGVMQKALPECKIIHITRSPIAVCWSQYKSNFSATGLGYSNDIQDIADYYNIYKDLMEFWYEYNDHSILEINYEKMTENPKSEISPVLAEINLNWDDELLNFYKKKKITNTASKDQVNKPIYKGSSEEWKKYEKYLQSFIPLSLPVR